MTEYSNPMNERDERRVLAAIRQVGATGATVIGTVNGTLVGATPEGRLMIELSWVENLKQPLTPGRTVASTVLTDDGLVRVRHTAVVATGEQLTVLEHRTEVDWLNAEKGQFPVLVPMSVDELDEADTADAEWELLHPVDWQTADQQAVYRRDVKKLDEKAAIRASTWPLEKEFTPAFVEQPDPVYAEVLKKLDEAIAEQPKREAAVFRAINSEYNPVDEAAVVKIVDEDRKRRNRR